MSSSLYIPPSNIRTQIIGTQSRRALCSRWATLGVLKHADPDPDDGDQHWYIVPSDNDTYRGQYRVVSAHTGQGLYIKKQFFWGEVGTSTVDRLSPHQYFLLEKGRGPQANQFRLKNLLADAVIFSRTHMQPGLGSWDADDTYPDHWFTLDIEPLDYHFNYDLAAARIVTSRPIVLFTQELINNTGTEQTQNFTVNKTTQQQHTWAVARAIQISGQTTFRAAVPYLDVTIMLRAQVTRSWNWGQTNTTTQSWTATVPVRVPPNTTMRAIALVTESKLNVPFEITWTSRRDRSQTMRTRGVYEGLSYTNLRTEWTTVRP
jgi:hypothetical protein